jgi:hypothetical protein
MLQNDDSSLYCSVGLASVVKRPLFVTSYNLFTTYFDRLAKRAAHQR